MKIAPSKFQVGSSVVFGGTVIEALSQKGDQKRTFLLSPTKDKLDAFLNFPTPSGRGSGAQVLDSWPHVDQPKLAEVNSTQYSLPVEQEPPDEVG